MPTVRVYQSQVQQDALPTPRAIPADTSGYGELARGLGTVAGETNRVAQQELERAREAQVMDGYAQVVKSHQDISSVVQQQRGKDALEQDLVTQTGELFQNSVDTITQGYKDPEVQTRIKKLATSQGLQLRASVDAHVAQQSDQYAVQSFKSAVAANEDAASKAALQKDAAGLQVAIGSNQGAIDSMASKWGWDQATVDAEKKGSMDRIAETVVPALLTGENPDTGGAAAFLREHRAQLTEKVASRLDAGIAERTRVDVGYALAQDAAKFRMGTGEVDIGAADAHIKKIARNPQEARVAQSFLDQEVARGKAVFGQRLEANAANAMAAFTKVDPVTGKPLNSIAAVRALSPQAWDWLNNTAVSGMEGQKMVRTLEAWDREEKSRIRGERMQPTPDQAARAIQVEAWLYGSPREVQATPPEVFSSQWMNVDQKTGEALLSQADYQRLGNVYAQIHGKPLDQFYLENPKAVVIDEMREAFPRLKKPEAKWGELELRVYNEVAARAEKEFAGGKPDPVKLRAFVKGQISRVQVETLGGYGPDASIPKVQAEVTGRATTGAAPAAVAPRPATPGSKVPVVGPKGEVGTADANGLDTWLQQHPGWRRQ